MAPRKSTTDNVPPATITALSSCAGWSLDLYWEADGDLDSHRGPIVAWAIVATEFDGQSYTSIEPIFIDMMGYASTLSEFRRLYADGGRLSARVVPATGAEVDA